MRRFPACASTAGSTPSASSTIEIQRSARPVSPATPMAAATPRAARATCSYAKVCSGRRSIAGASPGGALSSQPNRGSASSAGPRELSSSAWYVRHQALRYIASERCRRASVSCRAISSSSRPVLDDSSRRSRFSTRRFAVEPSRASSVASTAKTRLASSTSSALASRSRQRSAISSAFEYVARCRLSRRSIESASGMTSRSARARRSSDARSFGVRADSNSSATSEVRRSARAARSGPLTLDNWSSRCSMSNDRCPRRSRYRSTARSATSDCPTAPPVVINTKITRCEQRRITVHRPTRCAVTASRSRG